MCVLRLLEAGARYVSESEYRRFPRYVLELSRDMRRKRSYEPAWFFRSYGGIPRKDVPRTARRHFPPKKSPSIRTLDDDATIFREDVFALAVKNRCFREATSAELLRLLNLVIKRDQGEIIHIAAEGGLLSDREMTAELIDIAAANKKTEIAAWLLDYQNRIFGSIGGTDYEL